ncbi:hypothetical protein [Microlunatus speluncae]|uniref:hypothetical protein n=1 Tax=Microlunatus speluncae TaxID=2594267 RepID=UPI0012664D9E|nr:hypothetical protein [Microlunatus speluncae]
MPGPTMILDQFDRGPVAPWAEEQLAATLLERGIATPASGSPPELRLLICPPDSEPARALVTRWRQRHGAELAATPESFAMGSDGATVTITGSDDRGLGYALQELTDLARYADDVPAAFRELRDYLERPYNPVRAITRIFTSAATDLAWLHDRAFWTEYLSELAGQRFNRFNLGLGTGYDYLIDRRVADNYLCFAYPFLLDVPGYEVRAAGVDDAERDLNLATLRFIGAEATRRGIEFGLGLWNHAYRYDPAAETERWPITGLDAESHAPYCRAALKTLLTAVPDVRRLTFRVHFEGGVPEPTHEFWRVVLGGLPDVGRTIGLDLHAKGVGDDLLAITTDLGLPLTLSAKHWGEHQGLPYHQASIREKERLGRRRSDPGPATARGTGHPDARARGTQTTSQRSFTRYGYGDFAHTDRPYSLLHRVWPGTQRVLLWGDPALAAGYGRHGSFADALGLEWFEPLSFFGKKDSSATGSPGGPRTSRALYRDPALQAAGDDWRKFRYTYRLLGRAGYEPDTPVEELTRSLRGSFGAAAAMITDALGAAARVLPLITVAHAPSTACNVYWPEVATPVPLVPRTGPVSDPFREEHGWPASSDFDMIPPYGFGNVSPLDPELIYGVDEFAADVLAGRRRGKHTPIEIAARLDDLADTALVRLAAAAAAVPDTGDPEFVIMATDIRIQAGLARHFAASLRAGVAYALRSLGRPMLARAVDHYRTAITAWEAVITAAEPYVDDLPFGQTDYSRGAWAARRPVLAADLATLERELAATPDDGRVDPDGVEASLITAPAPLGRHTPPERLEPGAALPVSWRTDDDRVTGVRLRFRPVNQALAYQVVDLDRDGDTFSGSIPAELTGGPYPVQYFFEILAANAAWPHPGLATDLANQPYYVVHADPATTWGRP